MDSLHLLNQIREDYQRILFEELVIIQKVGKNHSLEKFSELTSLFTVKLGFLVNGMFEMIDSQNIFVIKILYRVVIEYFITYNYLIIKFNSQKSDCVFVEYINSIKQIEELEILKSYKNKEELIDGKSEIFKKIEVQLNEISKTKSYEKVNFKKMISYIHKSIKTQNLSNSNNYLLNKIVTYSEMSSYIHGGYDSNAFIFSQFDEDSRIFVIKEILTDTLNMVVGMGIFALSSFNNYDKCFSKAIAEFQEMQKQLK